MNHDHVHGLHQYNQQHLRFHHCYHRQNNPSLPSWNPSSINLSVSCANLQTRMALCQLCKHSHHNFLEPSCLVNNQIRSLLLMKNLNPSQELVLFQYSFYFEYFSFWTNMRSGPWIRVATSTTRTMNRTSIPSLRLSLFSWHNVWWQIVSIW